MINVLYHYTRPEHKGSFIEKNLELIAIMSAILSILAMIIWFVLTT